MSSCPMHDEHVTSPCDRSRTNSEFDSIRGEYWFFESKNQFIRFFQYRYTTLPNCVNKNLTAVLVNTNVLHLMPGGLTVANLITSQTWRS